MTGFELHLQLRKDCYVIGELNLCRFLLMNDCRYPWVILVPQRPAVTEIFQLTETDQLQLLKESSSLAEKLSEVFMPDKMNIAALGNIVPQLHIHHVVRYKHDHAWPAPVWGVGEAVKYEADALDEMKLKINEILDKIQN